MFLKDYRERRTKRPNVTTKRTEILPAEFSNILGRIQRRCLKEWTNYRIFAIIINRLRTKNVYGRELSIIRERVDGSERRRRRPPDQMAVLKSRYWKRGTAYADNFFTVGRPVVNDCSLWQTVSVRNRAQLKEIDYRVALVMVTLNAKSKSTITFRDVSPRSDDNRRQNWFGLAG